MTEVLTRLGYPPGPSFKNAQVVPVIGIVRPQMQRCF